LFDGPMCRLESFHAGAKLELALSRTSYKPFLGTNLTHAQYADKYGGSALANAVGLSSALESSDGFLMLGRRNGAVAYYPGRVHPFAGALEPAAEVDVFADVRRELAEEVGLSGGDVAEIVCLGMAEDVSVRQPELIFRVGSTWTRARIERSLDAAEHQDCVAVEQRAETVAAALADPALTPIAVATLLLWGRGRFGAAWFDAASGPVTLGGHEPR
jgi:8-oxo-dGTP pyrophosphatase MutT (NUDIX family)